MSNFYEWVAKEGLIGEEYIAAERAWNHQQERIEELEEVGGTKIAELEERIQQLESKAAALYTLAERTCGDGCHCMKENNEKCALLETDNGR